MSVFNPKGPNKCEVIGCEEPTWNFLCEPHTELAAGLSAITACKKCKSILKIEISETKSLIWVEECEYCELLTGSKRQTAS